MSTTKTAPLYVQFAQQLKQKCAEMGLSPLTADTETGFPQNEGWFFVRFGDQNSAALIVPKSKGRMGNCHSHIDLSDVPGYIPLPKKNGRVVCHYSADVDLIAKHVLPRLPGASKRPIATPVKATPAAPVDLSAGQAELDSWIDSTDDVEEEVQALAIA